MSRNFELLTQIECELGGTENRIPPAVEDFPATAIVPTGVAGDEMLRLVQRVFLSTHAAVPRQVVFCGVDRENGSDTVCVGAARALAANSSRSVCLIDANARSPRLPNTIGVDTTIPFTGKSASLRDQCTILSDNLWLAGPRLLTDSHGGLLGIVELKRRFARLLSAFEHVLIDAPATSESGDAALLGQVADATILVIEANTTRRLAARKAKDGLEAAGVHVLGTVLHNRTFAIPEAIYNRL